MKQERNGLGSEQIEQFILLMMRDFLIRSLSQIYNHVPDPAGPVLEWIGFLKECIYAVAMCARYAAQRPRTPAIQTMEERVQRRSGFEPLQDAFDHQLFF